MSEFLQELYKPNTKQEMIDCIGNITLALYDRAKDLPQLIEEHVPLEWNNGICYNATEVTKSARIDDSTNITVSRNIGGRSLLGRIAVDRINPRLGGDIKEFHDIGVRKPHGLQIDMRTLRFSESAAQHKRIAGSSPYADAQGMLHTGSLRAGNYQLADEHAGRENFEDFGAIKITDDRELPWDLRTQIIKDASLAIRGISEVITLAERNQ